MKSKGHHTLGGRGSRRAAFSTPATPTARQEPRPPRWRNALALLAILVTAGCTNVKPWERSVLADYTMRADRDPLAMKNSEHVWFSREAASGGRGVGGGGCGCN